MTHASRRELIHRHRSPCATAALVVNGKTAAAALRASAWLLDALGVDILGIDCHEDRDADEDEPWFVWLFVDEESL